MIDFFYFRGFVVLVLGGVIFNFFVLEYNVEICVSYCGLITFYVGSKVIY